MRLIEQMALILYLLSPSLQYALWMRTNEILDEYMNALLLLL